MVLGGVRPNGKKLKSIEIFDTETKKWNIEFGFELEAKMSHFCAVNLQNRVYVIGGQTKKETLNTVSYFIYEEQKWHKCKPMTIARSAFSAVIGSDRKIYVLGGYHGVKPINHVERYDINEDKWEVVA